MTFFICSGNFKYSLSQPPEPKNPFQAPNIEKYNRSAPGENVFVLEPDMNMNVAATNPQDRNL